MTPFTLLAKLDDDPGPLDTAEADATMAPSGMEPIGGIPGRGAMGCIGCMPGKGCMGCIHWACDSASTASRSSSTDAAL